ncbi:hypothetical protein [Ralstonia solanacearum]|uniref:hypothetical protein n=1 Tax=Ralstonia solanacearum TaxID=305 RepID=UPI0018D101AC|nr:hypothetical protein [Ralstonia solanacearum]MDC6213309.1 hypothetical protein [Ralstonia solanacearum]MDD7803938.1 hypothetical protein [Ralstonia solanacearum]
MKFSDQDRFEFWLMEMNDSIQRFLDSLPEEIARQLGFSVDSLTCLELWLISRYQSPAEIMQPTEAQAHDGAARYIGETFRRSLGGKWRIDFLDKKNVYFGVPQIVDIRGQMAQFCPHALVTTLLDRRRGDFLVSIFRALDSNR